ncbi:MAG: DNRLRE domain-containing protein [Planctomycetes bacterium]|nr:DNRLRE domain-containing protein [Planctomycetota bacterium]
MHPIQLALHFGLAMALASSLAAQTTTVSVPCDLDNTLYEDLTGSLSNGRGSGTFCGLTGTGRIRRAVMRFDVASVVPAGAWILSAKLDLFVEQSSAGTPAPASAYRLSQDWGEGSSAALGNGGGGAVATPGDATWIHTFYSGSTWTTPGGSFAGTPSFTMTLPTFGAASSDLSLQTAADVASWLGSPSSNFGWLIKLDDEVTPSTARRLASRENGFNNPSLEVTYLMPGQVGTYGVSCSAASSGFTETYVGVPTGGNTVQIVQTNAPANSFGYNVLAFTIEPAGVSLAPGCTAYLPLGAIIIANLFPTDPFGSASTPFPLPIGFPGALIAAQSIVADGSPFGYAVSNAAVMVLQ